MCFHHIVCFVNKSGKNVFLHLYFTISTRSLIKGGFTLGPNTRVLMQDGFCTNLGEELKGVTSGQRPPGGAGVSI